MDLLLTESKIEARRLVLERLSTDQGLLRDSMWAIDEANTIELLDKLLRQWGIRKEA